MCSLGTPASRLSSCIFHGMDIIGKHCYFCTEPHFLCQHCIIYLRCTPRVRRFKKPRENIHCFCFQGATFPPALYPSFLPCSSDSLLSMRTGRTGNPEDFRKMEVPLLSLLTKVFCETSSYILQLEQSCFSLLLYTDICKYRGSKITLLQIRK